MVQLDPTFFRMLDLIAHCADGHGPVHLLLVSAAEIGFAWDGAEGGWIRAAPSLPALDTFGAYPAFPERYLSGLATQSKCSFGGQKGFSGSATSGADLCNYLTLPTCGKEIKCC